jgi:hypothetical protein
VKRIDDLSEEEGQNERVAEVTNKAHSEIVTVAV